MEKDYMPLSPFAMTEEAVKQLDPMVLAFVGDAVQTLFVRTKLAAEVPAKSGALHKLASGELCAVKQSKAVRVILDELSDEETAIFKRARNAKTLSPSKSATQSENHSASGFEALIGYLYLTERHERLNKLLSLAYGIKTE